MISCFANSYELYITVFNYHPTQNLNQESTISQRLCCEVSSVDDSKPSKHQLQKKPCQEGSLYIICQDVIPKDKYGAFHNNKPNLMTKQQGIGDRKSCIFEEDATLDLRRGVEEALEKGSRLHYVINVSESMINEAHEQLVQRGVGARKLAHSLNVSSSQTLALQYFRLQQPPNPRRGQT
eukprot:m.84330 g.84330  ORF g.84330 m.84330 type:complete len:180 (+) comp14385_c0_seq1:92-631(+)